MEGDSKNLPDISDEHIIERIDAELADIEAEDSLYSSRFFRNAPTFNDQESRIIGIFMILRPNEKYRLTYESLIETFNLFSDGEFAEEEGQQLIESVKQMVEKGIFEEVVVKGEDRLVLTETGAIIYKMWVLAGKLMMKFQRDTKRNV